MSDTNNYIQNLLLGLDALKSGLNGGDSSVGSTMDTLSDASMVNQLTE